MCHQMPFPHRCPTAKWRDLNRAAMLADYHVAHEAQKVGDSLRRRALAGIAVVLAVFVVQACDASWSVHARNETNEDAVLRISFVGDTLVYRLPVRFDGTVYSVIGSRQAPVVQWLKAECTVVATVPAPPEGAVLVVLGADQTITATPTQPTKGDQPHPEELRGECGSSKVK